MKERETITLFLDEYLEDMLGHDDSRPIRVNVAEILDVKLKGKLTYHVQWPDQFNPELSRPLLWKYSAWADSVERWTKQRERSERERVAKFIFDKNVELIAEELMVFGLTEEQALGSAFGLLKKNDSKLSVIDVKLITKESEL